MSTRLEGVQIPIEIDASKALHQLDQIESSIKKDSKKAVDLNRTLSMNSLLGGGGGERKGAKSGTTGAGGLPIPKPSSPVTGTIANAIQGSTPVSGVLGKVAGLAAKYPTAATLAEGATGAAAIYAGVKAAAGLGGRALAAIEGASPGAATSEAFKAVAKQITGLQSSIEYMEAKLSSYITGIGKTIDMETAMARVNGRAPNALSVYGVLQGVDEQEGKLNKAMERFKANEFWRAVGDSFREGWNK